VRRFGVLALVVSLAAIVVSSGQAALFFLFEPAAATANEMVTVRLGGTPASFTFAQREEPLEVSMQREPNGTLFDKLGWLPKKGWGET
jgi:hypothetical protein